MDAGRELDALVAVKVMGWQKSEDGDFWITGTGELQAVQDLFWDAAPDGSENGFRVFYPSTDIAAAWQVVEHLWRDHWWIKVSAQHAPNSDPGWQCRMDDQLERHDPPGVVAHGETAPLAICRAALAAVVAVSRS